MTAWLRRVPKYVKVSIPIALLIVVLLGTGAFFTLGAFVQRAGIIMPNISIDGIDVSGLTYTEAMQVLNESGKEVRAQEANVTIILPGGFELTVTGEDVKMRPNSKNTVINALAYGYREDFIKDALLFVQRHMSGIVEFHTEVEFDTELLSNYISGFASEFNHDFNKRVPRVFDDKIVITKGAGYTRANAEDIFAQICDGLYESFISEQPVTIEHIPKEPLELHMRYELASLWEQIRISPVSAWYDFGTRSIIPDTKGVTFSFEEAWADIKDARVGQSLLIAFEDMEADITKEYMESYLFVDIIGEETSYIGGTSNRLHNVTLASELIDGTVLEPGEEFSFNRIVGPRTSAAGFRQAPVLISGQFVPGIGGGICQVSSTLYSSILDTDILVTERLPHGRPVDYLPRNRDATVAWGLIDFRFVNNTDYPIRIDIEIEGRNLTVRVEGTLT